MGSSCGKNSGNTQVQIPTKQQTQNQQTKKRGKNFKTSITLSLVDDDSFHKLDIEKIAQISSKKKSQISSPTFNKFNFQIDGSVNAIISEEVIKEEIHNYYPDVDHLTLIKNIPDSWTVLVYDKAVRDKFIFKRRMFYRFEKMVGFLLHMQELTKFDIPGIGCLSKTLLHEIPTKNPPENTAYAVDLFWRQKDGCDLQTAIKKHLIPSREFTCVLLLCENIGQILVELHSRQYSYQSLKPSSVFLLGVSVSEQIVKLSPRKKGHIELYSGTHCNIEEQGFISAFAQDELDMQKYDVLCLGFILLCMLNQETLTFSELYAIRKQEQLDQILNKSLQGLPMLLTSFIQRLLILDKTKIPPIKQVVNELQSITQKGPQTDYKQDAVAQYLTLYQKDLALKAISPFLFFYKQDKINIYNMETKMFKQIHLTYGGKKWPIKTSGIAYSSKLSLFITFAQQNSQRIVCIDYDEKRENIEKVVFIEKEVKFLHNIASKQFDAEILIKDNFNFNNDNDKSKSHSSWIFLFSDRPNKKDKLNHTTKLELVPIQQLNNQLLYNNSDNNNNNNKEKFAFDDQLNNNNEKLASVISEVEGGVMEETYKKQFHFYDPHNEIFYVIPEQNNIFLNGIKFFQQDSNTEDKFMSSYLGFACSHDALYEDFCNLNFNIKRVFFCVEVQHGVFLACISKLLLVMDFNLKCFYSFCSFHQIASFTLNQSIQPFAFQFVFEMRNLPFLLTFPNNAEKTNVSFDEGLLQWLCQKEKQIVLCKFLLVSDQAALQLLSCRNVNTGKDLLGEFPKEVPDIWGLHMETTKLLNQGPKGAAMSIRQYKILQRVKEKDEYTEYDVIDTKKSDLFRLRQIQLDSLQQFTEFESYFFHMLESKYLVEIVEGFLSRQGDRYYSNIIISQCKVSLKDEVQHRMQLKQPFSDKEMAFILKCVFKALIFMAKHDQQHGHVSLEGLVFDQKGHLRSDDWFLPNLKVQNDRADSVGVMMQLAVLQLDQQDPTQIQAQKQEIDRYPGLYDFLKFALTEQVQLANLNSLLNATVRKLQYCELNFSLLKSTNQTIFWIQYGSNNIVSYDITRSKFHRYDIFHEGNHQLEYRFSTFNMFCYDNKNTLYVTGNNKIKAKQSELKTQSFYKLELDENKTEIHMERQKDIPFNILGPTAFYHDEGIYLFGGYEMGSKFDKITSKKVFFYQLKTQKWVRKSDLPMSLVQSSAESGHDGNIFLFGGYSDDFNIPQEYLNFLEYNTQKDIWDARINFAFKSPFQKSRHQQPKIVRLYENIFVSLQQNGAQFTLEIFELAKGGFHLKFKHKDLTVQIESSSSQSVTPNNTQIMPQNIPFKKEKEKEHKKGDLFNDISKRVTFHQDSLSLSCVGNCFYALKEGSCDLLTWNIINFEKPSFVTTKCCINATSQKKSELDIDA